MDRVSWIRKRTQQYPKGTVAAQAYYAWEEGRQTTLTTDQQKELRLLEVELAKPADQPMGRYNPSTGKVTPPKPGRPRPMGVAAMVSALVDGDEEGMGD